MSPARRTMLERLCALESPIGPFRHFCIVEGSISEPSERLTLFVAPTWNNWTLLEKIGNVCWSLRNGSKEPCNPPLIAIAPLSVMQPLRESEVSRPPRTGQDRLLKSLVSPSSVEGSPESSVEGSPESSVEGSPESSVD